MPDHIISITEFNRIVSEIERYYTKEELQRGWYYYALRFYKDRPQKTWDSLSAGELLHLVATKKSLSKAEQSIVAFSVMRNAEVFNDFLTTLPSYLPALFKALIYEKILDRKTVASITGTDLLEPPVNDYGQPIVKKEFTLFANSLHASYYGYSTKHEHIKVDSYLPLQMKKLLVDYFPKPTGYTINTIDAPGENNLVFFNAEESINRELPALFTYYLQQQIKYSEKGKPNAAGMKKLQRSLQLNEFLPNGNFPAIRSLLMAGLIFDYKVNSSTAIVSEAIKFIFQHHFLNYPLAPYIFTQLKGFSYFHPHEFDKNVNRTIWQVFSLLTEGQWTTMENMHIYVKTHFLDLLPLHDRQLYDKVYYEDQEVNSYNNKEYISTSRHFSFIYRPFLAGAAYLFGAFGLMELAYENKDPEGEFGQDWFSEYDGLKAVRLTTLGAYVLGLRKDYEALVLKSDNRLMPDNNSLMIRVEGNPALAHIQLANYAQKIADNRYQFSPAIFLKECKTGKDITNKITFFRQSVGVVLPQYWEDYLGRLINNNKLITSEKKLNIYRLPPQDKELQRLLVHDEVLKKLVIKAEQYYILVEKTNEALFRSRLKEAGILLE